MLAELIHLASLTLILVAPGMPSAAPQQTIPDDALIKLERTVCFGECPAYSVTIDAKGNVTYQGDKFVRVVGRQTDRIPLSRVAALLETVDRIRFFELQDKYRLPVTDNPTTFVTVVLNGRTKRIEDYVGAPKEVKQFEQQIDDAARTKRWIRLDQLALTQMVKEGWSPSVEERAELLRNALLHDDVDVVKGLIEIGADPNGVYYNTNTTPLMMVRSAAAARALLEAGALPSARNENGLTAMWWATHFAPDVTEALLKAGAQPDQPSDSSGGTPLFHAACSGNAGVVKLLLDAGADPAVRPQDVSALECAQRGRESARTRPPLASEFKQPFEPDFDGVIALLEKAHARRAPRK